jgi:hypothetical protein
MHGWRGYRVARQSLARAKYGNTELPGATPGPAQRPLSSCNTTTSTRNISINMSPIEAALAAIKALEPGEKLIYTHIAAKYGIDRTTLARRH